MEFLIQPLAKFMEFIIQFIGICNTRENYGIHISIQRDVQPRGKIYGIHYSIYRDMQPHGKLLNSLLNL